MNIAARKVRTPNRVAQLRADLGLVAAMALVVSAGVAFEVAGATPPVPWPPGAYLLGVGASSVLLIRRTRPVEGGITIVVLVVVYHFLGYPGAALALFAALYFIAATDLAMGRFLTGIALILAWQVTTSLPPASVHWY
ncbi:hypothetical protein [Arthrobacter sp. H35-D1]|uniref:hypothetical protein n=1 Tax=Arthrobacter sp. H35-D1 TaxID=3046202 RepID=UPI0024BBC161|nr:hypothetical protein [Arthrobacter sp. H35-D1]MDJ0312386.1 hypothetical protein [Arthrobacter sp. H35-D1]